MQFAVIMHDTESSNLPLPARLALVKQTFEMLSSRPDPRIKATYSFAGERAGLFIIETSSHDELQDVIGALPFSPIVRAEVHPISSTQSVLKTLQQAEERMARMAPAGASTGR
jgi:muconolactone delta-isomerase